MERLKGGEKLGKVKQQKILDDLKNSDKYKKLKEHEEKLENFNLKIEMYDKEIILYTTEIQNRQLKKTIGDKYKDFNVYNYDPYKINGGVRLENIEKCGGVKPDLHTIFNLLKEHHQIIPKDILHQINDVVNKLKGSGSFFGNIGRAFNTTWNKPVQSKAEGDALKFFYNDFLPIASIPINTLAPPLGKIGNIGFNKLREHQGV